MVGDKISNLIIALKNASTVNKKTVSVPYTKLSQSILETLKKENFINDYSVSPASAKASSGKGEGVKQNLDVELKYDVDGDPAIHDVKRVSKFSKRVYKGSKDIRPVKSGYGVLIMTTPSGIMTGKQAHNKNVGGEALFEIW